MKRWAWTLSGVAAWVALAGVTRAQDAPARPITRLSNRSAEEHPHAIPFPVPLDRIAPPYRDAVAQVVTSPTLTARHGPSEPFRVGIYDYLVEHPDRASLAWRRLGVTACMEIKDRGNGWFGWDDGQGNSVAWATVYRADGIRVWYAEGQGKSGPLAPAVPMKAVAVLRDTRQRDERGRVFIRHECDVYLYTDSKAAALLTKLFGQTAPRMAEQGATQLLLFFSSLTKYFELHPEDANAMLAK